MPVKVMSVAGGDPLRQVSKPGGGEGNIDKTPMLVQEKGKKVV